MFATLLAIAAPAFAWEHTGNAWIPAEDFPLDWYIVTAEEDSLNPGESYPLIQTSWDAWNVAECANASHTEGTLQDDRTERDSQDGNIDIFWNDPSGEIEAGVLGVTYPWIELRTAKETANQIYRHLTDVDIVFNDNVDFGSDADIAASCGGRTSIQGVATHEIGHLHGLDHSCEDGDACPEPEKQDATMFWSIGSCVTDRSDINEDDIESLTALYGPFASFSTGSDRIGGTPMTVEFTIESVDATVSGVEWSFGDGETSTEINPTHEYTTAGQFTVQAVIELEDPTCGTSTYTYDELGYIVACDEPAPAEGAGGFFTISHSDGLTWEVVNHADVSVYGCVDTIAWEVYQGTGDAAIAPENLVDLDGDGNGDSLGAWAPKITFPKEGAYTVVMNVGGPGGVKASFLTVDAKDVAAEGSCSTAPSALGLSFGGLALAAAAGLRRRRA